MGPRVEPGCGEDCGRQPWPRDGAGGLLWPARAEQRAVRGQRDDQSPVTALLPVSWQRAHERPLLRLLRDVSVLAAHTAHSPQGTH